MEITYFIIIALLSIVCLAAVWALVKIKNQQPEADTQQLIGLQKDLEFANREIQRLHDENEKNISECRQQAAQRLADCEKQSNSRIQQINEAAEKRISEAKEEALTANKEALNAQKEIFDRTVSELKLQLHASTEEMLKQRQSEFAETSKTQVGNLMKPLEDELGKMRELIHTSSEASSKNISSLEGALRTMVQQSQALGKDAENLANALKNRGKVHGDWGEQVLNNILQGSGLREGIEFLTQQSFKGAQGNELRPDVVVCCADARKIIIDSKVSLTAYTDYAGAESEAERQDAEMRNYDSIQKHYKELAAKNYPRYVQGSLEYVLMFVPNEGSYIMAMNHNSGLGLEAFRQGVIIVNPTNLMLALHLILQTWHAARREDNCERIIDEANKMYEKFVGVVDNCRLLGNQMETAARTYRTTMNQMTDGTGNLLRRMEGLKEMGVTSTKQVKRKAQVAELPELIEEA